MKKLVSLIMVLAMVLAMGITAFADETTGSITVTNATLGKSYSIYKIFDASIKLSADQQTAEAVSYSIEEGNQFFNALFGTGENQFFTYNADTGSVTKKEGVNDSDLVDYLTDLIDPAVHTTAAPTITPNEQNKQVVFEDLPYGYYLIKSSLGSVVTINSNTPDVSVIDKNQEPAPDFKKEILTDLDEDGDGQKDWGESNSANIGDSVTYRISFTATNYDGDKKIQYYQVHDTKGNAIWAEFDSFKVTVNGTELTRGYYLSSGGDNTGNWGFLGDWGNVAQDRNNAQWYLVHLGYEDYRITIPWLEGHTVTDVPGAVTSYKLDFADDAASKFTSPALVEVEYTAVVEANANIGSTTHGNRYNRAYATWTSENETGSTSPDEVVTYVYGIGLLKDDAATGANLVGAKFRLYRDKDCTDEVYVIPTDIDGVYIVDSLGTPLESVTGTGRETTRGMYPNGLAEYLGTETQDNYVVSQVNGKLAILGLKAGTYYLKEVEAPAGYNALTQAIAITAGEGTRAFAIFANDATGEVADIQQTDGIHTEHQYDVTHTTVHNSKGVELPSTGGEGTMLLITLGTVLVIGFAVFLITHKKMSIYTD